MANESGKQQKMKNYVISLTTATDRREHIINEFGKQGIEFEFFDAITPDLNKITCKNLDIDLTNNQRLSDGEKACFLSHLCLWQSMIDNNTEYLVIFEDDIILSEDIKYFLNPNFMKQSLTWDIIKLETFFEKTHITNNLTHQQRIVGRLKSPHMGAGAYIINKQGAIKLINQIKNTPPTQLMAIDHILFEMFIHQLQIYQISPAPCIQSMFLDKTLLRSQLESHRQSNAVHRKHNDNLITKVANIFRRLKRSIGKRTYFRMIDFR